MQLDEHGGPASPNQSQTSQAMTELCLCNSAKNTIEACVPS